MVSTVLPDNLEIPILGARSTQNWSWKLPVYCVKCDKIATLNLHNSATGAKHISEFTFSQFSIMPKYDNTISVYKLYFKDCGIPESLDDFEVLRSPQQCTWRISNHF